MSKNFSLDRVTQGIQQHNVKKDNDRIVEKWSRYGLLKGLAEDKKVNIARLLENQAYQLLKESNALSTGGGSVTSAGQIQGFSSIVFPLIRRVFGALVATEIVTVHPMSLPSGIVMYLDYTHGNNVGGDAGFGLSNSATQGTYTKGNSIYNNPAGAGIRSGSLAAGGQYDLVGGGYSKVHQQTTAISHSNDNVGSWNGANEAWSVGSVISSDTYFTGTNARFASYDADVNSDLSLGTLDCVYVHVPVSQFTTQVSKMDTLAVDQIAVFSFGAGNNGGAVAWGEKYQGGTGVLNLRRHNKRGNWNGSVFTPDPLSGNHYQFLVRLNNAGSAMSGTSNLKITASVVLADQLEIDSTTGATLTIPAFETDFGSNPSPAIPELDLKIQSIALTAQTRKLRVKWTPELAHDLNAFHSLDAEAELTKMMAESMTQEIDMELLQDLVSQANAANLYWSRAPGKFVDMQTGKPQTLASALAIGPAFTGNIQHWYMGLIETINQVSNTIKRKILRGSGNFIVTSPDICTILESTYEYKAKISIDSNGQVAQQFGIGAENVGSLNNRYQVYMAPYFPRNKVLVGYKSKQALDTGFIYAPYVPLTVTETIMHPEDFTPRRSIMTRYAKKMLRSDFYGTVTVLDLGLI
jgi:hypothetical protein